MVTTRVYNNISKTIHAEHDDLSKMVGMLSETNLAILDRDDKVKILAKIIRKSHLHFIFEETLFKKHAYPQAEKHKDHHRTFIHKLDILYLKYLSCDEINTNIIAEKLSEMIDEHTSLYDADFEKFIVNSDIDIEFPAE